MPTNHHTLSAEIRKLANIYDLGEFNTEFFMRSTFISDLASYVQKREEEAYQRGLHAQATPHLQP